MKRKRAEEKVTASGQQYTAAHEAQYKEKDLAHAVTLYAALITEYPDSPEAKYSRSQVHNIARSVVPEHVLIDSHLGLIASHLKTQESLRPPLVQTRSGVA